MSNYFVTPWTVTSYVALLWDFPGKNTRKWKWSRVGLFATPWTIAYQAPPSMGFSRQEYWSGLPFPSPGDLPTPGIEPGSPALQTDALLSEPPGKGCQYLLQEIFLDLQGSNQCFLHWQADSLLLSHQGTQRS